MRGRIITGGIALVLVLVLIACQKCNAQTRIENRLERKAERSKEKLACDSVNIRRAYGYSTQTVVDISWDDSTIVVKDHNRKERVYHFCKCTLYKYQDHYEVERSDALESGFIVIDMYGVEFNLFQFDKLYMDRFRWKTRVEDGKEIVIEEPLKKRTKQT